MASVKECDRCSVQERSSDLTEGADISIHYEDRDYGVKTMELCHRCLKALETFLERLPEAARHD
jgi:hypothetical protein